MPQSDLALLAAIVTLGLLIWMRRKAKTTAGKKSSPVAPLTTALSGDPQPLPPSPPSRALSVVAAPIDTDGAVEDMRLAYSYLDDWIAKKSGNHVLGLAAKYIDAARRKNPYAKLVVVEKDDLSTYSQDDLSGWALFYESQHYSRDEASPEELQKARAILERAIAYAPYSIQYRSHLADVYLNLHDKDHALAVAREAVEANPKNLDARKLMDRIDAAPVTVAPTYFQRNPDTLVGLASLMFFLGFLAIIPSMFGGVPEGLPFFLFIVGGVLWFYGRSKEKQQTLDQAIAHLKRKGKR